MFFTESRENDYPRLGKRPKPLSRTFYRKWLGLQDSRNIYTYDSDSMDIGSLSDGDVNNDFKEKDGEGINSFYRSTNRIST